MSALAAGTAAGSGKQTLLRRRLYPVTAGDAAAQAEEDQP